MKRRLAYKEFRKDGWPYCPNCEEDELYSYLMLGWVKPEPPTLEQCLLHGMKCYRCSWESSGMNAFGNKCFRCKQIFETPANEPDYVNCPPCRETIRQESEQERVRAEVERMDWPSIIEASI